MGRITYPESTKIRAAWLFIAGGQSLQQIALLDDMPSHNTLISWSHAGEGNQGVDWREAKEAVERDKKLVRSTQVMEKSVTAVDNVVAAAKQDVLKAVSSFMAQLQEQGGFKSASYSQLKDLYQFLLDLENRDALGQMLEIMKDFVAQCAKCVTRNVTDERERGMVRLELQETLMEYQKRLEPLVKMSKAKKL